LIEADVRTYLHCISNVGGAQSGRREGSIVLNFARRGTEMANLSGIVKQLKKERDLVRKQLLGLETALTAFAIAYSGSTPSPKRRKLSAKARAKIAAGQRARWAKVRKSKA
jgi:hypothetical protein